MLTYATTQTPPGPLTVVLDDDGAVRASGWTSDAQELLPLIHPKLLEEAREAPDLGPVTTAIRSYLDGDLTAIDVIPVRQHSGGPFMTHAWRVMREIKPGAPVTYTQFAELAGRPAAIRGAASACAKNPAALFTPCHRVLRLDGSLGGFRWGLPVKAWLLEHEGR